MTFLNCPAYLDQDGAIRCGLPAEVRSRFTMRSTDGPLESVMIRCPAGHYFNGPIESLSPDSTDNHDSGTAGIGAGGLTASSAVIISVTVDRTRPPGFPGRAGAERLPEYHSRLPHWPLPHGGSQPRARAAGAPPPVTCWEPP